MWRDIMASTWGTLISAAYEIYILSLCDAGSLELDGYAHKGEAEADGRFLGAHLVRNVALMLIIPYWVEAHVRRPACALLAPRLLPNNRLLSTRCRAND